jgi:hypothetical protein
MPQETKLYPMVASFAASHFGLWLVKQRLGTQLGNMDVVGIREARGDFSSTGELFAIEVKEEGSRFLASIGQALAYTVYVHYPYLAVRLRRRRAFSQEEKDIAARFGVGLIAIRSRGCTLVSTARRFAPEDRHVLQLYSRLSVFRCSQCGGVFKEENVVSVNQPGPIDLATDPHYRGTLRKAVLKRRHVQYWVYELAQQRSDPRAYVYDRRFLCRDCVSLLASIIDMPRGA